MADVGTRWHKHQLAQTTNDKVGPDIALTTEVLKKMNQLDDEQVF